MIKATLLLYNVTEKPKQLTIVSEHTKSSDCCFQKPCLGIRLSNFYKANTAFYYSGREEVLLFLFCFFTQFGVRTESAKQLLARSVPGRVIDKIGDKVYSGYQVKNWHIKPVLR